MVKHGLMLSKCLNYIKLRRPIVNPNPGFYDQLKEYSKKYV